jgi:hypothetical protein
MHHNREMGMNKGMNDQWRMYNNRESDYHMQPFKNRDMNPKHLDDMANDSNMDSKDIKKKKERGMSRLRMRRGPGRSGKLTKSGLDMQSFFKTKICPYLLSVPAG